MAKLRLFIDPLSQPSRAVLIFCLVNKIDVDVKVVSLAKREHHKPEFQAINPMGQVPAIDDDGFLLFESHAILRYLASSRPHIADHWYPSDIKKRAQLECILDWHHTNLRRGSAVLVYNLVIAPLFGLPSDAKAASEAETRLRSSLQFMEDVWLQGGGSFLTGSSQPSIADLSLACEVSQLHFLDKDTLSEVLDPRTKVKIWLDAVEKATAPHFVEVHGDLHETAKKLQEGRAGVQKL